MKKDKFEKYIKIFQENHGILRAVTAIALGVPEYILYEMQRDGKLIQESRGLYRLAQSQPLGNPDLVQVGFQIPKGVVFLISALFFHNLTTQIPDKVYVALPQHIKKPRIDYPPLKFFYLSEKTFGAGIEEHIIDGVVVKIYSKEKTVTDCFKYRQQIGKDIALEALKDYMRQSSPNINLLIEYAKINRIEKILRPYIETLL
ncbi:MAG: type IV toxin-antitoxin system AbiEi family antitoxin domain-containing protein [Anaerolineales bacterium]